MKFKVGDKVRTLVNETINKCERLPVGTVGVVTDTLCSDAYAYPYRIMAMVNNEPTYWWYSADELEQYVEEKEEQEESKRYIKYDEESIRAYCELRQNAERKNPYTGNAERFMEDAEEYLNSIFFCNNLDVPEWRVKTMAAYFANRMIVTLNDCLYERDREWKQSMKRGGYPVGQYEHSEKKEEKKASIDKDELRFRIIGLIKEAYGDMMFDSERNLVEFVNHNPHWKIICEKLNLM